MDLYMYVIFAICNHQSEEKLAPPQGMEAPPQTKEVGLAFPP